MPETIPAGRLVLRPLRPADAPEIARHCADPRVARMTTRIPHPYPPGAAQAFVEDVLDRDGAVWAMDGARGGLPDLCGLISLDWTGSGNGELGYWVAPPLWGRGLATGAVVALVRANPGGSEVMEASAFHDNPASAAVLRGAGFARVGEDAALSIARGGIVARWRFRRSLR